MHAMATPLSSRSTPNISPSAAVSHTSASTVVDAPIEQVWNILLDTSTWPAWNTFCPRVTILAQPSGDSQPPSPVLQKGTQMTFHVHMNRHSAKETATHLVVTDFEPPSSASTAPGTISDASTSTPTAAASRMARITWVVDRSVKWALPSFLLNAERVHELVEIEVDAAERTTSGDTTTSTGAAAANSTGSSRRRCTEVRTWEAQAGWLAYVVRWLYGARLQEVFRDWVQDLRRFVEDANRRTAPSGESKFGRQQSRNMSA